MAKKTILPDGAEQAPEPVVEPVAEQPSEQPKPFATFRYLPYATVKTTFPSGVPATLQFDGDGLFHCADNQWWSAVCRATVDPDLPPGHISQVIE